MKGKRAGVEPCSGRAGPAAGAAEPGVSDRLAGAGLLLVAVVWGGTFPVVKQLVEAVPPHSLLAGRFGVGALLLAAFAVPRRKAFRRELAATGVLIGVVFGLGYLLQTVGLQHTSASKAGFITALNVVFIPVLARVISGRRATWATWAGVGVATVGLALMTVDWSAGLHPQPGDMLVLACAVMFALHIVLIDRFASGFDPVLFSLVQVVTVALLSGAGAAVWEGGVVLAVDGPNVARLLFLGVFATAGAVLTQVYLQPATTPTRAGLIFSTEPVFAALFAWLLLGERMAPAAWIGGALVVAGVLLSEREPAPPQNAAPSEMEAG